MIGGLPRRAEVTAIAADEGGRRQKRAAREAGSNFDKIRLRAPVSPQASGARRSINARVACAHWAASLAAT
jgi:hypothetical protein